MHKIPFEVVPIEDFKFESDNFDVSASTAAEAYVPILFKKSEFPSPGKYYMFNFRNEEIQYVCNCFVDEEGIHQENAINVIDRDEWEEMDGENKIAFFPRDD